MIVVRTKYHYLNENLRRFIQGGTDMACNFTLDTVVTKFQLEIVESAALFAEMEAVVPSPYLTEVLTKKVQLAIAIGTEKAKSELIVADILFELREQFNHCISFFSGIEFSVDEESGLTGVCDFLVSLSPVQHLLQAPIIVLVEAKKDDLKLGMGQCVAEMLAAQRFNAERKNDIPCVYGAATTGIDWLFLKLDGKCLHIDMTTYQIAQCEKVLGILASMVAQKA